MVICFGGHCYEIVFIPLPIGPSRPGPGPINYPQLFRDATIVSSVQEAAKEVSDASVREALLVGTQAAVGALQARGGSHVSVRSETEVK
jgi:hypothetical protein